MEARRAAEGVAKDGTQARAHGVTTMMNGHNPQLARSIGLMAALLPRA